MPRTFWLSSQPPLLFPWAPIFFAHLVQAGLPLMNRVGLRLLQNPHLCSNLYGIAPLPWAAQGAQQFLPVISLLSGIELPNAQHMNSRWGCAEQLQLSPWSAKRRQSLELRAETAFPQSML